MVSAEPSPRPGPKQLLVFKASRITFVVIIRLTRVGETFCSQVYGEDVDVTYLTKSSLIRDKIKLMFSPNNIGLRRVIVVAYIGKDACEFIPEPSGIEIICWPLAGATNPHGVAGLQAKGAKIYFCEGLHSKLYWTEGVGGLVTSANLSANALKHGIQREFGVFISQMSSRLVEELVAESNAALMTSEMLDKLFREHKAFWSSHNSQMGEKVASCKRCGEVCAPPRTTKTGRVKVLKRCSACLSYASEWEANKRGQRRDKAGCASCGKPSPNSYRCEECTDRRKKNYLQNRR